MGPLCCYRDCVEFNARTGGAVCAFTRAPARWNQVNLGFFTALLPQFINPTESIAWQVLILGVSSVVAEFFVLIGYGFLAGQAAHLAHLPHLGRITDRIAGVLLVGAGTGLALAKNE